MTDYNDTDIFEDYLKFFSENDFETIKKILSSENFDINKKDSKGFTALHCAVQKNDFALTKFILDLPNVDINAKDEDSGFTALIIAVMNENPEILQYLLERGADVSATGHNNYTALIIAADSGSVECLEILLEQKGCDVNAENFCGATALMVGAEYPEIVKRLIDISDLSKENVSGANAFHYACYYGSLEVVKMLLETNFFDLNKKDNHRQSGIIMAINKKHFDVVEFLLEKGVRLDEDTDNQICGYEFIVSRDDSETFFERHDCPDSIMIKAIEMAASYNRAKTLKIFIDKLLLSGSYDKAHFFTAVGKSFAIAAAKGHLDSVKFLLSTNLIIENYFNLALKAAIRDKHFDCLQYIYNHSPQHMKIESEALLDLAVLSGVVEVFIFLLEHGISFNGKADIYLMESCNAGNIEMVKLLVEHGADINSVHAIGGTALHLAIMNKNVELAKYLIKQGADITVPDENGYTPLICSAYRECHEIFYDLFAMDNDVHHVTNDGFTVFLVACCKSDVGIVKTIFECGPNINAVDIHGNNCFHNAVKVMENRDVLLFLSKNIENKEEMLYAKNNEGKMPLDWIIEHGNAPYLFDLWKGNQDFYKYICVPEKFEIDKNEDKDICLVCREEFVIGDVAYKLPCNHVFHELCFIQWILCSGKCPYCKKIPFTIRPKDSIPSSDIPKTSETQETPEIQEASEIQETGCCCIS